MQYNYLKAPAKINVGLRVLSKRNDGYHNIETIFYPVKLFDKLLVTVKPALENANIIKVLTFNKKLGKERDNLCYKAAELFLKEFSAGKYYRISIRLHKEIPVGAGLGGGSSDAATVIKYLAEKFKLDNEQKKKLKQLALQLGSDVPFFLEAKPAYAYSRGEKLKFLPAFKIQNNILIVYPGIHVSTAKAYSGLNIKRSKQQKLDKTKKFDPCKTGLFSNDFEESVFSRYPEIRNIKDVMYKMGALFSSMSGSGSSVYGIFPRHGILDARKYFHSKGYSTYIVKK